MSVDTASSPASEGKALSAGRAEVDRKAQNSRKVLSIVTFLSKYTRALTFENFSQGRVAATHCSNATFFFKVKKVPSNATFFFFNNSQGTFSGVARAQNARRRRGITNPNLKP